MTTPVFEVKNLDYSYADGIPALRNINFSVMRGESVALVGANGSGKSTLLRLLDGLIYPSGGEIYSAGMPLTEKALQNISIKLFSLPCFPWIPCTSEILRVNSL